MLAALRYAHEHGVPWDEYTCADAARNGHLECLKYAHEHGCPWTEITCSWAAYADQLECLQYAHEHGCPYPSRLLFVIVRTILLPKWRAHVRACRIALYWNKQAGRTACAPEGAARKRDRAAFESEFA